MVKDFGGENVKHFLYECELISDRINRLRESNLVPGNVFYSTALLGELRKHTQFLKTCFNNFNNG